MTDEAGTAASGEAGAAASGEAASGEERAAASGEAASGEERERVVVRDVPAASRYEARVGDALAGFLDYRLDGGRIVLVHTETQDGFEGRGVGSALVEAAFDAAGDAGLAVVPECPFVRTYLTRHPERLGQLDEASRASLASE